MAEPGNVRWNEEQTDTFFADLRRPDTDPDELGTDQGLYLDHVLEALNDRRYTEAVARWMCQRQCRRIRKQFTARFVSTLSDEMVAVLANARERARNVRQQREMHTSERREQQMRASARREQLRSQTVAGTSSGSSTGTTAQESPGESGEGSGEGGPSYTHRKLGTVHAKDVAGLSEDSRSKVFGDIEAKLFAQQDLTAIDAFLAEPTVQAAWVKHVRATRPVYEMSVQEFLALPATERRSAFERIQLDLADRHLARFAGAFFDAASKSEVFTGQWTHYIKTDTITDADGLWVEQQLWAVLDSPPLGRFATEGLKLANTDKDLLTKVMAKLHELRKAHEPRVVPWLMDKNNRKIENQFDEYLKGLRRLGRSNSRTDGSTRGTKHHSRLSDKQRRRIEKENPRLEARLKVLEDKKRHTVGSHRRRQKLRLARFLNHLADQAELNRRFLYRWQSTFVSHVLGIKDFSSADRQKFCAVYCRLLVDKVWALPAQTAIRDVLVVDLLREREDYFIDRKSDRTQLQEWITANVVDSREREKLIRIIKALGAKAPIRIKQ